MTQTIVVCGHGPGISHAVAKRFGKAGFQVALVARRAPRLATAVAELERAGIAARAFPWDLSNVGRIGALFAEV